MSKLRMPLWRGAHFEAKMFTTLGVRTTFGSSDVASLHYTTLHCAPLHYTRGHYTTLRSTTLHYTTSRYTTRHYTTLHYTTLSSTTPHYLTLHYTPLHYNYNYNYTTRYTAHRRPWGIQHTSNAEHLFFCWFTVVRAFQSILDLSRSRAIV